MRRRTKPAPGGVLEQLEPHEQIGRPGGAIRRARRRTRGSRADVALAGERGEERARRRRRRDARPRAACGARRGDAGSASMRRPIVGDGAARPRRRRRAGRSSRSACASAAAGRRDRARGARPPSASPQARSSSTVRVRSRRRISGVSCARRPACSSRLHRRTQRPGPSRPARPARCSADARLIGATTRRSMPCRASKRAMRARPASTTAATPSTVSAVSATLVASTTRRRGPRTQRALLLVERLVAVQRHDVDVAQRRQRLGGAADLAGAGQEHEHVAARSCAARARTTAATCSASRTRGGSGAQSSATGMRAALRREDRGIGQMARRARSVASVADMTTSFRSGRTVCLELAHDGQREVALQMALVELVEHDDADVLEERVVRRAGGRTRPR